MQRHGCRALTNLSCGGDECRKAVRDAGGANALMLAMEMHPEDLPLARLRLAPCIATCTRCEHAHHPHACTLAPAHALTIPLQAEQAGRALRGLAAGGIEGVRALLEARATRLRCPPSAACLLPAARLLPPPSAACLWLHHDWRRPRTDSRAHPPRPAAAGCCPIQPMSSRRSASALSWRRSSCCSASTLRRSTGRTAPPGARCCSTPPGTACCYSLAGCCWRGADPGLAVHLAADCGQVAMVRLLLQWGAPLDALDERGVTMLSKARGRGAAESGREVASLLEPSAKGGAGAARGRAARWSAFYPSRRARPTASRG